VSLIIESSRAHLTRVSTLSSRAAARIRPVIRNHRRRRRRSAPVSCCLSATGIGFSGHPASAEGLGLPHGRLTGPAFGSGPQRGCHVAHAWDTTGVGAPYTPGTAVPTRPTPHPRPPPAASQRPVPIPRCHIPPSEAKHHDASSKVYLRSPVRSSPAC